MLVCYFLLFHSLHCYIHVFSNLVCNVRISCWRRTRYIADLINVLTHLPILYRVNSSARQRLHNCPATRKITLNHMGKLTYINIAPQIVNFVAHLAALQASILRFYGYVLFMIDVAFNRYLLCVNIKYAGHDFLQENRWIALFFHRTPDNKIHGAHMGPSGADSTQVGPMLAPWTLLSGTFKSKFNNYVIIQWRYHKVFCSLMHKFSKGGVGISLDWIMIGLGEVMSPAKWCPYNSGLNVLYGIASYSKAAFGDISTFYYAAFTWAAWRQRQPIVWSRACSGYQHKKHKSPHLCSFVTGGLTLKWPVLRKAYSCNDVILPSDVHLLKKTLMPGRTLRVLWKSILNMKGNQS